MTKLWYGAPPERCDICGKPIYHRFIDGATQAGPWAMMCMFCHRMEGVGIGEGRGQQYTQQEDGTWAQGGTR